MTDARRLNEARFSQTAGRYARSGITERHAQQEALLRLTAPEAHDRLLDVACGPGALLAVYAPRVRHAVGVDLTMAMLREARARRDRGSIALVRAEAERLPFADGTFSIVVTTWAVHHFGEPRRVLGEMARVCRPGGRVAVGDLVGSEDDAKRARQNRIERLRDPAHVEVLSPSGLTALLASCGLTPTGSAEGSQTRELGEWCAIAATPPDVSAGVRKLLLESAAGDLAGMLPVSDGDVIRFQHRWAVIGSRKP